MEAWLLASKWRWQELLDAVDAAGDGAGEYVRQADNGGYTALHRSVRLEEAEGRNGLPAGRKGQKKSIDTRQDCV